MRGSNNRPVEVSGGLDIWVSQPPRQHIGTSVPVDSVALQADDYRGVQAEARVDVGDVVRPGQPLFVDAARPEIRFTAPGAGVVRELRFGRHRRLHTVVVALDAAQDPGALQLPVPNADRASIRTALLAHGLWPALRTHPLGLIPDPDAQPAHILVTAMDSRPLAPDARLIIEAHREAFLLGVRALMALADAPVTVCQGPGAPLASDAVRFRGRHPVGLPGTHARRLCAPVEQPGASGIWHIGYQDAIAIGYLVGQGRLWTERCVTLAGPAVREPRLCTVPLGARLRAFGGDGLDGHGTQLLSGSVLGARAQEFLGRYHLQVSGLYRSAPLERAVIVPVRALERVAPDCCAPVPLLRALSVGDLEAARRLGALELAEEDVALLGYTCTSKTDYGPLLRQVHEQLGPGGAPQTSPAVPRDAASDGLHAHASRSLLRIRLLYMLALAAPLGAVMSRAGAAPWRSFGSALLVSFGFQFLFARLREQPVGRLTTAHALVFAASVAVMVPPGATPLQVALGSGFGVVFGELVFGGYGLSFVNPALVTLAFLDVSFASIDHGAAAPLSVAYVVPGALVLLWSGIVSVRSFGALLVACAALLLLQGGTAWPTGDRLGSLVFAALIFGCDPVSSAATRPGRWLYGLFAGTLLGLALSHPGQGLALPLLAAQGFAPLFDRIGMAAWRLTRRPRHG